MGYRTRSKVYVIHNYDGQHDVAVVATNMASAAKRAGRTANDMRAYGYHIAIPGKAGFEIHDHQHLYRRPIGAGGREEPFTLWREVFS